MFYCEACRPKEWPATFCKSYGRCELCKKEALCNDMPSSRLPELRGRTKMDTKDLTMTRVADAPTKVPDMEVYGDGDTFALLCKASSKSQGWMKSTKVCNVAQGCIVQVTTQQRNPDGSYAVAEALTYVPNVWIDVEANPRRLMDITHFHPDYVATVLETGQTHA